MDRAKDADREESQRYADEAHDAIDCAKAGTPVGVFNPLPQHDVGDIYQQHDRRRYEAWIPCPPGIPYRPSPDRTGHDINKGEDNANLDRRYSDPIPALFASSQINPPDDSCYEKRKRAHPPCGDVKIEHTLDITHDRLLRCPDEYEVQGDDEYCAGQPRQHY